MAKSSQKPKLWLLLLLLWHVACRHWMTRARENTNTKRDIKAAARNSNRLKKCINKSSINMSLCSTVQLSNCLSVCPKYSSSSCCLYAPFYFFFNYFFVAWPRHVGAFIVIAARAQPGVKMAFLFIFQLAIFFYTFFTIFLWAPVPLCVCAMSNSK